MAHVPLTLRRNIVREDPQVRNLRESIGRLEESNRNLTGQLADATVKIQIQQQQISEYQRRSEMERFPVVCDDLKYLQQIRELEQVIANQAETIRIMDSNWIREMQYQLNEAKREYDKLIMWIKAQGLLGPPPFQTISR